MRREDFAHVIGAAAMVTEEDAFVVIGSQGDPRPDLRAANGPS